MPVFQDYAEYYDILYHDKQYDTECLFVLDQISRLSNPATSILDLGCGTGRHGFELARNGIAVTGVDLSSVMVKVAQNAKPTDLPTNTPVPVFMKGDARSVRLGKKFGAVVSLFHVMSYQNTEEDALGVFETAYEHLDRDGLFFFDFWHGPGVLMERPEVRDLHIEHEGTELLRHAEPKLFLNENRVDVAYTISLKRNGRGFSTFNETHCMRYWFFPELKYLARQAGFAIVGTGQWLSEAPADDNTWLAWMAVKRL